MIMNIALIFALYVVFRAIQKVIGQYKHLNNEELRDVLYSQVDRNGSDYGRIIRHLGLCEKCQDRLHNFKEEDHIEDHLVE